MQTGGSWRRQQAAASVLIFSTFHNPPQAHTGRCQLGQGGSSLCNRTTAVSGQPFNYRKFSSTPPSPAKLLPLHSSLSSPLSPCPLSGGKWESHVGLGAGRQYPCDGDPQAAPITHHSPLAPSDGRGPEPLQNFQTTFQTTAQPSPEGTSTVWRLAAGDQVSARRLLRRRARSLLGETADTRWPGLPRFFFIFGRMETELLTRYRDIPLHAALPHFSRRARPCS